ncbi:MAG TPA: hypothetical protein DIT01_07495 [Lentisphaeria bacterium]|mgnify:CR=1 FL=1|nr:hypothetical protein [Lentisphaeria bacterium]
MAKEQVSGMTDEERFRFDLTGFIVRPAILAPDEIAAIIDQIDRIKHDPESLPEQEYTTTSIRIQSDAQKSIRQS